MLNGIRTAGPEELASPLQTFLLGCRAVHVAYVIRAVFHDAKVDLSCQYYNS